MVRDSNVLECAKNLFLDRGGKRKFYKEGIALMLFSFDGLRPIIGNQSYVSDTAQVIGNVDIGANCYIGPGSILRGDYGRIEIGDGTALEEGVIVHSPPGGTNKIGSCVTIGHGAIVHGKSISDYAVVGMGAVLGMGSIVGEFSIVAEGTVVKQRQVIPAAYVAAGNPARIVRTVSDQEREFWIWGKRLYADLAKKYLDGKLKVL